MALSFEDIRRRSMGEEGLSHHGFAARLAAPSLRDDIGVTIEADTIEETVVRAEEHYGDSVPGLEIEIVDTQGLVIRRLIVGPYGLVPHRR